ncbi:LIC_12616 family protein [Priestia aryabhattai]|uniref:phage neck terminator protein n=1 Tax=Priestia megaterium TaxID=1404 RepID=UPI0039B95CF6
MNIAVIKEMIAQIKVGTGIQIIKSNTINKPPPLPYGVYNITSPYIKGRGRGALVDYAENGVSYQKRIEQYKFTISFSFYAGDIETTMENAFKVHQWFLFMGQEFIRNKNLAVVEVGNIQDRTTFLVEHYEYKHGFDVHFRATDEQIRELSETIETINLGGI